MLACTAALAATSLDFNDKDRHISYLPLAHIYERAIYNTVSFKGGSIGIFGGDVKKLVEDM